MLGRAWMRTLLTARVVAACVLGWAALALVWQWALQGLEAIAAFDPGPRAVLYPYIASTAH